MHCSETMIIITIKMIIIQMMNIVRIIINAIIIIININAAQLMFVLTFFCALLSTVIIVLTTHFSVVTKLNELFIIVEYSMTSHR